MEALSPEDAREIAGYRLRARLGEGGMGMVYLSHTRGGQPVALKVVRREYAQDPEFRKRFTQEVAAARRVQGPYTAPVLDSFTDGPEPWLAVSYVPGPSSPPTSSSPPTVRASSTSGSPEPPTQLR